MKKLSLFVGVIAPAGGFAVAGFLLKEPLALLGFCFVFYLAFGPLVYLLNRVSASKGPRI